LGAARNRAELTQALHVLAGTIDNPVVTTQII
jgi:hypothetical protein